MPPHMSKIMKQNTHKLLLITQIFTLRFIVYTIDLMFI